MLCCLVMQHGSTCMRCILQCGVVADGHVCVRAPKQSCGKADYSKFVDALLDRRSASCVPDHMLTVGLRGPGTHSYVLTGTAKGMAETFGSTCHGAGRARSRNSSRRQLDYQQVCMRGLLAMLYQQLYGAAKHPS